MKANIWGIVKKERKRVNIYITVVDGIKRKNVVNRTTIPTGLAIEEEFWDTEKKEYIHHPDKETLQIDLETMLLNVRSFINENRRNNITIWDVKAHFVNEKREKIDFIDAVANLLDEIEKNKELKSNSIATHRTDFRTVALALKSQNASPSLDEVNLETWKIIESYCITKRIQNSTTNCILKNFKKWMNSFEKKGLVSASFLKDLKKQNVPIKKFEYLNTEELDRIKNLQLDEKNLIRVRDLMLVQKDTGLRMGDLMRLNINHYNLETNSLELTTQKNNTDISVPFSELVLDILEKYDYCLPSLSSTNYNIGIKKICRLAGLTHKVRTIKHIGTEIIEKWVDKYIVIASHTLRRSFITNGLKGTVSSDSMMILIGSKDKKTFEKYNSMTKLDACNEYVSKMYSSTK